MIRSPLEVLIVEGEEPITAALSRALARRGHRVATSRSMEKALGQPPPDVLVCEGSLDGACGLDLLAAMRERGDRTRSVLLLASPTVEDCLRALRLGADALLTKPFRVSELIRAVEEGHGSASAPSADESAETTGRFGRSYRNSPESVGICARDLAAFALRLGIPPSARARLASAAAEIVENAHLHGRLRPGGRIRVCAELVERALTLSIRDEGAGFDPRLACAMPSPGPALTGLARAMALADGMRVETTPGAGTEVALRFGIATASLDARTANPIAGGGDLSEADFLIPGAARNILLALIEGETRDVSAVPPAIAVVLGRLLSGPDPWSGMLERAASKAPFS